MILRIYTSTSADQAKGYYVRPASKEAYYSEGQEFTGYWGGSAAAKFGLDLRVDEKSFSRLCDNLHPETGEQLTPRMKENRRVGTDITFNMPKSVSLLYAYTKDERILQAVRQVANDTIAEMEQLVAVRVRGGGVKDGSRNSGNWVAAEFVHLTARPVGGVPDPHLHLHFFVPNVTLDPVTNKWMAADVSKVHENANYFNAMVTLRLATKLKELGLPIENHGKSFEIAGIGKEIRDGFSRRTKLINEEAERRGITDAKEKAGLGARTRENKTKTLLIPELEQIWWADLPPEVKEAFEGLKTLLERSRAAELTQLMVGTPPEGGGVAVGRGESSKELGTKKQLRVDDPTKPEGRESVNKRTRPSAPVYREAEPSDDDRRAVAAAATHIFERRSAVTEMQLIAEAANHWRYGEATAEGIWRAVKEMDFLRRKIGPEVWLTTAEVLAEERRVIEAGLDGILTKEPMNENWKIEDETLNKQQRAAVLHVLNSRDLIVGIMGKAGTGKTTLLHEAKRGIEAGLNKLLILAPTAEAARDVLRGEGFSNAETVARFLQNGELQNEARGAVVWVDEAGLISTPQMDQLLALTKKLGARLVLAGDPGQHRAVERGQAFEMLQKDGGMKVASVEEVMRQRGMYKRLVEHAANRDSTRAFKALDFMASIREIEPAEMDKEAAKQYVAALKRGESVGAISPTHKECDRVTAAIRAELRQEKKLFDGVQWAVLKDENWTEAQKSDWHRYSRGQIVQINRHVNGFALGEQLEVIGPRDGMVRVRSRAGFYERIKALPLAETKSFGVYKRAEIEVCEGEKIRVTCNHRTKDGHRLFNGKTYNVDYIDRDGKIVLENGWRLDKSFKHLEHGYTETSHSAQGKTYARVIVVQSACMEGAGDTNQFYVSISRGKKGVMVITDNIPMLQENVSRVRDRLMATDLVRDDTAKDAAVVAEREKSSDMLGMQWENPAIQIEAPMVEEKVAASGILGMLLEVSAIQIEEPEHEMEMEL